MCSGSHLRGYVAQSTVITAEQPVGMFVDVSPSGDMQHAADLCTQNL